VIEHRSLLELSLSIERSLFCVIEQLVIRHYILVELSLEVQGGQDYFPVCGRNLYNCLCSFFLCSLTFIRCTKTLNLGTVLQNVRKKFLKTQFNPPPPSCGFSHLHFVLQEHYSSDASSFLFVDSFALFCSFRTF